MYITLDYKTVSAVQITEHQVRYGNNIKKRQAGKNTDDCYKIYLSSKATRSVSYENLKRISLERMLLYFSVLGDHKFIKFIIIRLLAVGA
jgi:hypothetical protein